MNEVLSDKEKKRCLTYQFLYPQYHHVDSRESMFFSLVDEPLELTLWSLSTPARYIASAG